MGIFSKKRITLIVREFEVNSSATDNDPLLRIRGHRKGFLFWILRILGLKDPVSPKIVPLAVISPDAEFSNVA